MLSAPHRPQEGWGGQEGGTSLPLAGRVASPQFGHQAQLCFLALQHSPELSQPCSRPGGRNIAVPIGLSHLGATTQSRIQGWGSLQGRMDEGGVCAEPPQAALLPAV